MTQTPDLLDLFVELAFQDLTGETTLTSIPPSSDITDFSPDFNFFTATA